MTTVETIQSTPTQDNEAVRFRLRKIGMIDIDIGTVVIGDPSHMDEFLDHPPTVGHKLTEQRGRFVLASTGIGDGRYPVYAELVDDTQFGERVGSLHIHFFPEYHFADDPQYAALIKREEADFLRAMNVP